MEIIDFVAIGVVGALLSAIVQVIKDTWGTESNQTKLITIVLSIVIGGAYVWLRSTPFFETTVMVLMAASTVYALLLRD
jgi:uncharacterized membrane protein YeaQ/YmgE (transglycosylase-associated protein family)